MREHFARGNAVTARPKLGTDKKPGYKIQSIYYDRNWTVRTVMDISICVRLLVYMET